MKDKIRYMVFLMIGCSVYLSSCNDDYETWPIDYFNVDYLFSRTDSLGKHAESYYRSLYSGLNSGYNRFGTRGFFLDAASDDGVMSDPVMTNPIRRLQMGFYSASDLVASEMIWAKQYECIRRANFFLNHIDRVPTSNKYNSLTINNLPIKYRWKAEARMLRAYYYWELVRRYGGVPIMADQVYSLGDDVELPRNSFEECVNYILKEIDLSLDSLQSLPVPRPDQYGFIITRQAAEALKVRILLYVASPLFNESPVSFPGHQELAGYTQYDKNRWKLAADAALDFINQYGPNSPVASQRLFSLLPNYRNIFAYTTGNSRMAEHIFVVCWLGGADTGLPETLGPLGFVGDRRKSNGAISPSQNLVDAFPMINGKAINEEGSGYNPFDPYVNRDPRFYATILYNGARWLSTTLQTYENGSHNPNSATTKTRTSYYLCKFCANYAEVTEYTPVYSEWVAFRFAEILLNYAEALNEYLDKPSEDVYNSIIQLRRRAGIQAGADGYYGLKPNMTQSEMRETIRNERRIEMAFEEQRYYDIRRWKIAHQIFNNTEAIKGLNLQFFGEELVYNLISIPTLPFEERHYLYPFSFFECAKNKKFVQNPGW